MSKAPPKRHCAHCSTRLLPDFAWTNWLWGKRCQACRARYCRTCVRRHVRRGIEWAPRAHVHELAHQQLERVDLENVAVTSRLGAYDPRARFGSIRPDAGGFVVGDEVFAHAVEAAADAFARYVLMPDSLTLRARDWVRETAGRESPAWTGLAANGPPSDAGFGGLYSSVYECDFCGHLWGEIGAAEP